MSMPEFTFTPEPADRCILVCHGCTQEAGGEPLIMPFTHHDALRDWQTAHERGTGHQVWTTFSGWPAETQVRAMLNHISITTALRDAVDRQRRGAP